MLTRRPEVYDPSNLIDFSSFNFLMWPGYYYNLIKREQNLYLSLKSIYQVIRTENVLEKLLIIRELSIEQGLDYQEEIRKVFNGIKVVTK